MEESRFWGNFAAGAAFGILAGAGAVLLFKRAITDTDRRILRMEKSVNIGGSVREVFAAWSDFERLPQRISFVKQVSRRGRRSRWLVDLDGRLFRWETEVTQVVPEQSVAWKSLSGPKHSGRISFAPLGEQTVMHVTMNYAPPMGRMTSMLPIEQHLENWIERGLREFKNSLERAPQRMTGTGPDVAGPLGTPGKRTPADLVPYTRPPEKKS